MRTGRCPSASMTREQRSTALARKAPVDHRPRRDHRAGVCQRPGACLRARWSRDHRGHRVQTTAGPPRRSGDGAAGHVWASAAGSADCDGSAGRAALLRSRPTRRRLRHRAAAGAAPPLLAHAGFRGARSGDRSAARRARAVPALHGATPPTGSRPSTRVSACRAGWRRRRTSAVSAWRARCSKAFCAIRSRRVANRRNLRADARDRGLLLRRARRARPHCAIVHCCPGR